MHVTHGNNMATGNEHAELGACEHVHAVLMGVTATAASIAQTQHQFADMMTPHSLI